MLLLFLFTGNFHSALVVTKDKFTVCKIILYIIKPESVLLRRNLQHFERNTIFNFCGICNQIHM